MNVNHSSDFYCTLISNDNTPSDTTPPPSTEPTPPQTAPLHHCQQKRHIHYILHLFSQQEDVFLNRAITRTKNEHNSAAKHNTNTPLRVPSMLPIHFLHCNLLFSNQATMPVLSLAPAYVPLHSDLFPTTSMSVLLCSTWFAPSMLTPNPKYGSPMILRQTGITSASSIALLLKFPSSEPPPNV